MPLRAIAYPEAGEWVAHCLDLDIVATGADCNGAFEALVGAVEAQIADVRANDNFAHLFMPAPPEAWRKLAEILQGPREVVTRALDNNDDPPTFALHLLAA